MKNYYWIVAAGNIKKIDGVEILNAETMHVCNAAVDLIAERHGNTGLSMIDYRVACCARNKGMSEVTLGTLMSQYFVRSKIDSKKIVALNGETFDTVGEARAMAMYLKSSAERLYENGTITITIVVRWWHAPRAYVLFKRALKRREVPLDRLKIKIHRVSSCDLYGMVRECFAWPYTWMRMPFGTC